MTSLKSEAIFGAADGLTSALGVVAAGLVTHAAPIATVTAASALAVAAAVSMGGSEWLADTESAGRGRRAFVMGAATLAGSVAPAIGFLFGSVPGLVLGLVLTVLVGVIVAVVRPGSMMRSLVQTFAVLIGASIAAVAVSVLCGAVG